MQALMLRDNSPSAGTYITLFLLPWVLGLIFHESIFIF
jgi:hypothetical protein